MRGVELEEGNRKPRTQENGNTVPRRMETPYPGEWKPRTQENGKPVPRRLEAPYPGLCDGHWTVDRLRQR